MSPSITGPYGRRVRLSGGLSQGQMSLVLRERDMSRIAVAARLSGPAAGTARLTRRSTATHESNVTRTRYRPCNNREMPLKLAHGTHALHVYGAAGVEPAQRLDPRRPDSPWRRSSGSLC
jgi:hypothetical protein